MKYDISVIGSGISGLSISQLLNNKYNVTLFEKEAKIGGLIKCDLIDNVLFHKVGGHVFNSNNDEVLNWFWKFFDKEVEFTKAKRNAKILLNDKIIGYPIENHLFELNEFDIKSIIDELLELKQSNIQIDKFDNFKHFLISVFGNYLYELYFEPYNRKIWNVALEDIPLNWLEGKLPMPNISNIILSNILKKDETSMVHSTFFYPKKNGSQFIVDRLSNGLNIITNSLITSVNFSKNNKLILNGDGHETDHLIYTGDIRMLKSLLKFNDSKLDELLVEAQKLKTNGTSNVLCDTNKTDISWLYLPNKNTKAHRIIYTGNFSQNNNGKEGRNTCVVEFSGFLNQEDINIELKKLPGNLKPISYNYEKNSYIIHNHQTKNLINKIKEQLNKYNIHLLGRFSEWEYFNMDKCIESAIKLENKINKLYEFKQ